MNIVRVTLFAAAGVMTAQAFIIHKYKKRHRKDKLAIDIAIDVSCEIRKDLAFVLQRVCSDHYEEVEQYFADQKDFYEATKDEDPKMLFFYKLTSE